MRKFLLLLLLLLSQLPSSASQIVVGLRSEHLISWGVWEWRGHALKHHLLLYNQGTAATNVAIKLLRFTSHDGQFQKVPTNKTFHEVWLAPGQLVRLSYPKQETGLDFTEYFEHGQSVGVLPLLTNRPNKALLKKPFRYYTNQNANSGESMFWIALNSIYALPTQLELTTAHGFYPPSELLKEEYGLVRLDAKPTAAYPRPGTLDSLVNAGARSGIVRLDHAHRSAVLPIDPGYATPPLTTLAVHSEWLSDGFRYDAQRNLVPEKTLNNAALGLIPIFHQAPSRAKRSRPAQ